MLNVADGNPPSDEPREPALRLGPRATTLLVAMALVTVLAHCATNFRYGFFRDELYYIEWSKHLAWGYVEQPPLTGLFILLTRLLLGDSLFALRLFPALCGGAMVLLTGLVAWELGGNRFAQGLAALSVMVGPTFIGSHAMMTMNSFDQFAWVACAYILVRLIRTDNAKLWLWFGVIAGLGLMNKLTMPFFGLAVACALLLTPHRRYFLRKEIWIGGAIAAALFAPFVVWMATHDWASIEFMTSYGSGSKTTQASFLYWLYMQVLTVHPLSLPIWLAGLYFCFFTAPGRPYRVLGWTFVILYAVFFALKAKYYFLSPAFPMVLAAGAVQLETWLEKRRLRWLKPAYVSALAATGVLLAPMAMPVLPVEWLVKYAALFGGTGGIKTEQLEEAELPQHFADQFGWESMVEHVARVYETLPEDEKARCVIFCANYGEAAAIDFYGPAHGLPPAISGHNTYHLWGPDRFDGTIMIAIVDEQEVNGLADVFDKVAVVGKNECDYCIPHERGRLFCVCRGLKAPVADVWPQVKSYG